MRKLPLLVLCVMGCLVARASSAGLTPDEEKRRSEIVVRVGPRSLLLGEVEDQLHRVPTFQLSSFGATASAARLGFVNDVVVRDALLAQGAEKHQYANDPLVRMQVARARATASFRKIETDVGPSANVSLPDVESYYAEHLDRYQRPLRILVWRVLLRTREEAQNVLAAVKKDGTTKEFTRIAREQSLDKVTNLRAGNLGFLDPNGLSNEAGVKVAVEIVRAAERVKDGEFVPEVVAEGELFAVVWRRGSTAPEKRALADATPEIRETLRKLRVEQARLKLIADLRAKKVRDVDTAGLGAFEIDLGEGTIFVDKRGPSGGGSAAASPTR